MLNQSARGFIFLTSSLTPTIDAPLPSVDSPQSRSVTKSYCSVLFGLMKCFHHPPRIGGSYFPTVGQPPSTSHLPWFWPWCFFCSSWPQFLASSQQYPFPFLAPVGRRGFLPTENANVSHMEHSNRVCSRRVPMPKQEPIVEVLCNNSKKILSLLIICLRIWVLLALTICLIVLETCYMHMLQTNLGKI